MQGIKNGVFLFSFVHAEEPMSAQIVVSHKWECGSLIFSHNTLKLFLAAVWLGVWQVEGLI